MSSPITVSGWPARSRRARARSTPSAASTSRCAPARSSACSAPTAPARPRRCACSPPCSSPPRARATVAGHDLAPRAARGAPPHRLRRPDRRDARGRHRRRRGADHPGAAAGALQGRRRAAPGRGRAHAWTSTASRAARCRSSRGGQRRRFDVALGLMHTPTVVFLDEPTTGPRPAEPGEPVGPHPLPARATRRDDPAHHPLPRRGRRARRPHPGHGRRPARRRRHRRRAQGAHLRRRRAPRPRRPRRRRARRAAGARDRRRPRRHPRRGRPARDRRARAPPPSPRCCARSTRRTSRSPP